MQIMREIALFSGKIYTAGTNLTRPQVVTVATNLNSVVTIINIIIRDGSLSAHQCLLEPLSPLLLQIHVNNMINNIIIRDGVLSAHQCLLEPLSPSLLLQMSTSTTLFTIISVNIMINTCHQQHHHQGRGLIRPPMPSRASLPAPLHPLPATQLLQLQVWVGVLSLMICNFES